MPTTTIRLDEPLKARVAAAAQRSGKSAHAFILDAIAQTVEQVEIEDEFQRVADRRWAKVLKTGETIAAKDMHRYLESRARGERPLRPAARKARR